MIVQAEYWNLETFHIHVITVSSMIVWLNVKLAILMVLK